MTQEELKLIHKEFRKFLRVEKQQTGIILNNLINAAEKELPALIRNAIDEEFCTLYDHSNLDELIAYKTTIAEHPEWLVKQNVYTSLQVLVFYIEYVAKEAGIDLSKYKPTEPVYFLEGDVIEAHGTRYERDHKARKACIEKFGCKCAACGFDFEEVYGEAGKGFIEVHHLKPLSNIKEKHETIPVEDLRPLCSNCHSIVHRRKPEPYTIEEIKQMIIS